MKLALAMILVPSIASCTWIYSLTEKFCDSCSIIEAQYTSQDPILSDYFRTSDLDFCISGGAGLKCDYLEFMQQPLGLEVNLYRNYKWSNDYYLSDQSFFPNIKLNTEGTYIQEMDLGNMGTDVRIFSIIDPSAIEGVPEPSYLAFVGFILMYGIIKWRDNEKIFG